MPWGRCRGARVARVAQQLAITDKLQAPIPTLSRGYRRGCALRRRSCTSPNC